MADADTRFLDLGFQYYTAGRLAFLTQLTPITGNLFHHAIEMQIKARLSQTHTLEELSKKRSAIVCSRYGMRSRPSFRTKSLMNLIQ